MVSAAAGSAWCMADCKVMLADAAELRPGQPVDVELK
jgi:hypothetical protein